MTPKTRSPGAIAGLRSVRRAIATAPWRISERLLRSIQPYHPPEIACGNWASNPRMAPSGGLDNRCVLMPAHSGLRCLLMALSVIRGTATFWQLLGQSGHPGPVLANLRNRKSEKIVLLGACGPRRHG